MAQVQDFLPGQSSWLLLSKEPLTERTANMAGFYHLCHLRLDTESGDPAQPMTKWRRSPVPTDLAAVMAIEGLVGPFNCVAGHRLLGICLGH